MLDNLTFTGRELLLAVVLATLVYLVEAWLFSRKRPPGRDGMEALRVEIEQLKARVDKLESVPPAGSALDTQASMQAEAIRLARAGHSAKELADQLGISLTEADLIIALHRSEA